MQNKSMIFIVLCTLLCSATLFAVTTLNKGVTLGNWLNEDEAYYIQTTRYTKTDFQDIQSLGCDHVRILVNFFTSEISAPDYLPSEKQLLCLDKAIAWANALGMKVVIANTGPELTDGNMPTFQERMAAAWKGVAGRYAGQGDMVLYEIYSSPTQFISAENWNTVAGAIIAAIREADATHTIIVGPVNGYAIDDLGNLMLFADSNILYAFNMFDPLIFTYQGGGSWLEVDYNTRVVEFPYSIATLPALHDDDVGTPVADAYAAYVDQGNVAYVQGRIDAAAQFATNNGVGLYCASFGAATGGSGDNLATGWAVSDESRVAWLEAVRTQMEAKGVPWCLSAYYGNRGIFDEYGLNPEIWMAFGNFPYDVNSTITDALGLTAPPDAEWDPDPMFEDFMIYDDELSELVRASWYLGDIGEPNFFVEDDPAVGEYCIGMFYPGQYTAIDLFFPKFLNLQAMAEDDYLVDFFFRSDYDIGEVQVRFIDSDWEEEEHPWRRSYTLNNGVVPFDGDWQRVTVPMSEMINQSDMWDTDTQTWEGPGAEDYFEWSAIQRFNLTSEADGNQDGEFYFDQIRIVSPTAVNQKPEALPTRLDLAPNYPNPFNPATTIHYSLPKQSDVEIAVFSLRGELVKVLESETREAGSYSVVWNGTNASNQTVASGIYIYRLKTANQTLSSRMVLIR